MMLIGANSREVVDGVKASVARSKPSLPPGVTHRALLRPHRARATHHPHRRDEPARGRRSSSSSCCSCMLGNLRAGLIVAIGHPARRCSRPSSACCASGVSGNLMSLGAIDFGLIVDGAVIVVENVVRADRRQRARRGRRPRSRASVRRGQPRGAHGRSSSAWRSSASSTCRSSRSTGIEGKMFRPMALTVLFALGGLARPRPDARAGARLALPRRGARPSRRRGSCARCAAVYEPLLAPRRSRAGRLTVGDGRVAVRWRGSASPPSSAPSSSRGSTRARSPSRLRLPSRVARRSRSPARRSSSRRCSRVSREVDDAWCRKTGRAEIATDPMGVEHHRRLRDAEAARGVALRQHARS